MRIKHFLLIVLFGLCCACESNSINNTITQETTTIIENNEPINIVPNDIVKNNYVSYNGFLSIENNNLVNQYSEKIMLRGMSSHGIQWFPEFINDYNIKKLKEWGANVIRIAMYTDEGGYLSNKDLKKKLYEMVDLVISNDMYVVIDWHILHDNNPLTNLESAKEFFEEASNKYKDVPNVIYEICNEPNGNTTWDDIYSYANEVINVIRNNSRNSIIIVGTPNWSQDVDKAALKPLSDELVMYALHFYAGTHREDLRNRLKSVLNKIPVFVSEFGITDASGYGNIDLAEGEKWINLLEECNISWINWSLTNKDEGASFLIPNSSNNISEEDLSVSGKFIKERLKIAN